MGYPTAQRGRVSEGPPAPTLRLSLPCHPGNPESLPTPSLSKQVQTSLFVRARIASFALHLSSDVVGLFEMFHRSDSAIKFMGAE